MSEAVHRELLALTQRLLDAIVRGDWDTYQSLCDPSLSAFEPEARGHRVDGMEFHHFYFKELEHRGAVNVTMCAPHVRMLGPDAAVVTYVRLVQSLANDGTPQTSRSEETRVWQRQPSGWQHVHFHRSITA